MAEADVELGTKRSLEAEEVVATDSKKQRLEGEEAIAPPSTEESEPTTATTSGPVTVGYRTFETGAAMYEYYKKLHSKLRKYQNLNEYEFHMVLELITKGHPDATRKLEGGVKAIQLQEKEHEGRRSSCFHLIRPDGTVEDVSYRKCISALDASMAALFAQEDNKQSERGDAAASGSEVQALCLNEDARQLYAGDAGGRLTLWNLDSMRPLESTDRHTPEQGILGLHLDPMTGALVSQGREGPVIITSSSSSHGSAHADARHSIAREGHSFAVPAMLPAPSTKARAAGLRGLDPGVAALALPHNDGVAVASTSCSQHAAHLPSPAGTGMVTSLLAFRALDGDHAFLLVGHEDGSLVVWALDGPAPGGTSRVLARRQLSKEPLLALAYCPALQRGVAGGPTANLLPFKLHLESSPRSPPVPARVGQPGHPTCSIGRVAPVPLGKAGVNCLVLRGDGKVLAAGGWDGRVRLFAFPSWRPLAILKYHTESATAVAFGSPSSGLVCTASRSGGIAMYCLYPDGDADAKREAGNNGAPGAQC